MQKPGHWYFIGCKPKQGTCEHCSTVAKTTHSLELHEPGALSVPAHVCLECAESLVRAADKGLPTWAEGISMRGGLGIEGWTSRWHWEDYNGPWTPIDVGAHRG